MFIGCNPGSPDQYLTCAAREPEGFAMTFYLFLPKGYTADKKYPLVLLLEGGGERAVVGHTPDQNLHQTIDDPYAQVWGPGFPEPYSEDVQGNWPSFIVIPQPVTPARFVDVPANYGSYTLADQPNDTLRMTKEIIDTLQLAFSNIDPNRLYLTGLSMGGYGAWEAAERWPDEWAAVVPIAGGGDPTKASRLIDLPIWAFQSANDDIVPISASRDMIQAIRAAGGGPRYTEYPELGHGAWEAPFTILGTPSPTPDFFAWLFAQHK
jgi:predicted peptidase